MAKDYFDHDGERERREQAAFDRWAGLSYGGGVEEAEPEKLDGEKFYRGDYVLVAVDSLLNAWPARTLGERLTLLGKVADRLGVRIIDAEAVVSLDGK